MIAVEFSLLQKAFHKQDAAEMCSTNLRSALMKQQTDYVCIGMFNTNEAADKFIKKYYDILKNYGIFETTEGNIVITE